MIDIQSPRHAEELPPCAEELPPHAEELPPHAEELPPRAEELPPRAEELPPPALRLGLHVLAHLRAIAGGMSPERAAQRYLIGGHDDAQTALAAHRAAVDTAARLARRAGMGPRWRLLRVGLLPAAALAAPASMTIEEWIEAKGYGGFSHAELVPLYEAECGAVAAPASRKARQIERLRAARLALLEQLRTYTATPPVMTDRVDLWFDPDVAAHLIRAGYLMLGELHTAIAIGGRWWRGLPGYGPAKARALVNQVGALVGWPEPAAPAWALDACAQAQTSDAGALVERWILARGNRSPQTERAYRREVQRFLAWLTVERRTSLERMNEDDCAAYIRFLQAVPPAWISRKHAERFEAGWAPFASQPSVSSQRYALTVINAFFTWQVRGGHRSRNPWENVNRRLPDDPAAPVDDSRAFTPQAWAALLAHVDRLPPAAAARMRWLLVFARACGLRAAELLRARRADFAQRDGAWWLRVHGKGARNRQVPVPSTALAATQAYFAEREMDFETAHPDAPLLAILDAPAPPLPAVVPSVEAQPGRRLPDKEPDEQERATLGYLSYSTLAPAFKRFVRAATAGLPLAEREHAYAASLHWLRHTHATRAVEGGVSIDVLQANLGQADPRTTARYFSAQRRRRMEQMERVFGASHSDETVNSHAGQSVASSY